MSSPLAGVRLPLGTLSIGEEIGRGGFGTVYRARSAAIPNDLAVKFLDPSPFQQDLEAAKRRFQQEVGILLELRHPFITPVYAVGEHDGTLYLVMEYFKGPNLVQARRLRGQPPPRALVPIFRRLTEAVAYAHSKRIVHRDIKPTNLMATRDDARVLDFGIAAKLDPDMQRLTRTGGSLVGDSFSAPEMMESPRDVHPSWDVYGLGACWYWLLTGVPPKTSDPSRRLSAIEALPGEHQRIILRCLDDADARYQSAGDLLADISSATLGLPTAAAPEPLTQEDIHLLACAAIVCITPDDFASRTTLEQGTNIAAFDVGCSFRRLVERQYLVSFVEHDDFGNEFPADQRQLLLPVDDNYFCRS